MNTNERDLYVVKNPKKQTVYDDVAEYLFEKYDIQYNEISHDFQISLRNERNWRNLNTSSLLIELAKVGIDISPRKLEIFIQSGFIKKYNPIQEYFSSLPEWDGTDYIAKYCSYVPTFEDEAFLYHFRKWLVRAVKCALEPEYFNKQAFIISHKGQSSGKSTWCRFLCPPQLSAYIAEDIGNDKDARIQLSRNFLMNLDELSVLSKKDVNALKAYFSKTFINERLPYDRKNTNLPRTCSFIGSTNMSSFLNDETGSVRWLCFELRDRINFAYSKETNIDNLWGQAYYYAYKSDDFNPELTMKDIKENEDRNSKYTSLTTEQELVAQYYEKSQSMDDFITATEVIAALNFLNLRLNHINIGRALSGFNFQRVKHPKKQVWGYLAKSNIINQERNHTK